MHADAALSETIRRGAFPYSTLSGQANLLVMPNVDAANIAYNLLKMLGGGVHVGPVLMGSKRPAHVVTSSVTVRGLINMSALTSVHVQRAREIWTGIPQVQAAKVEGSRWPPSIGDNPKPACLSAAFAQDRRL